MKCSGKVMFSQAFVILFGGGVCGWGTCMAEGACPHTVGKWAVHILLKCCLVNTKLAMIPRLTLRAFPTASKVTYNVIRSGDHWFYDIMLSPLS